MNPLTIGFKKKGQAYDFFVLLGFIVLLIIGLVVYNYVTNTLQTDVLTEEIVGENASRFYYTTSEIGKNVMDYYVLFAYIFMTLGVIFLSWLVRGNPIGITLLIVSMIIVGGMAMLFQDQLIDVFDSTFPDFATSFPITYYMLEHLLVFILITAGLSTLMLVVNA